MIHPATAIVAINPRIGRGVRAVEPIPLGTLLWVRDRSDVVIDPEALAAFPAPIRDIASRYGYRDHLGRTIICSDGGRFVNHSCEPNMRGVGPDAMIAVRAVREGDELTCDYAECNLDEALECECGSGRCRDLVRPDDLARFGRDWQLDVESAVSSSRSAKQPLLPHAIDRVRLESVLSGQQPCPELAAVMISSA